MLVMIVWWYGGVLYYLFEIFVVMIGLVLCWVCEKLCWFDDFV